MGAVAGLVLPGRAAEQPPGGSFAGESLPGAITWARAWLDAGVPCMDIGRGAVERLPRDVLDQVWQGTTPEWPIMAADLELRRDDLMAHYMSNHIAVAYGDIFEEMAALSSAMGFRVRYLRSQ
jgi:L-fucose isomerase-like protein